MSDLSERLVKAAFKKTLPPEDLPYFTMEQRVAELKDTKAAVAAVLRELAADRYVYGSRRLTELADEIEEKQ